MESGDGHLMLQIYKPENGENGKFHIINVLPLQIFLSHSVSVFVMYTFTMCAKILSLNPSSFSTYIMTKH